MWPLITPIPGPLENRNKLLAAAVLQTVDVVPLADNGAEIEPVRIIDIALLAGSGVEIEPVRKVATTIPPSISRKQVRLLRQSKIGGQSRPIQGVPG